MRWTSKLRLSGNIINFFDHILLYIIGNLRCTPVTVMNLGDTYTNIIMHILTPEYGTWLLRKTRKDMILQFIFALEMKTSIILFQKISKKLFFIFQCKKFKSNLNYCMCLDEHIPNTYDSTLYFLVKCTHGYEVREQILSLLTSFLNGVTF